MGSGERLSAAMNILYIPSPYIGHFLPPDGIGNGSRGSEHVNAAFQPLFQAFTSHVGNTLHRAELP